MNLSTTVDQSPEVKPWHPSQPHHELAADVRWWMGEPAAFGLFGRLALDQVAYRDVAAAVDASGRFAQNFTDRGIRSYLWGPLMLFGDDADREQAVAKLKHLHGGVKGRGKGEFSDLRYSALKPSLWKWVGTSSVLIFYTGYITTYGRELDDEQREVVYRTVLSMSEFSHLVSEAAQVPRTVAEMEAYYDEMAETTLADSEFLGWANRKFDNLPVPGLFGPRWLQLAVTPAWRVLTPAMLRPAKVCAEGAAHPRMRVLLGVRWNGRREAEFRVYLAGLRAARRWLPKRLVLDPLAYNRYRYEKLRVGYEGTQLASFGS